MIKLPLILFLAALGVFAQPPGLPTRPPLPPSPIQQFRDWLAMSRPEREKAVAEWPAEKRRVLLQKLDAYEGLPSDERDHRLRMLELRWYLRPLMSMAEPERKSALPLVPPGLRPLVVERLQHWDALEPATRREILANDDARELVTKYYLRLQEGQSESEVRRRLTPERQAELDRAIETWKSLSAEARSRTTVQLTAFFQLPQAQQARAFEELTEAERQDVERTLQAFARLSPEQRRVCVESFQKFTMMPPPERASFLRNAARWQSMTPEERGAWKNLVTKFPPLPSVHPPLPRPAVTPSRGKVAQKSAQ